MSTTDTTTVTELDDFGPTPRLIVTDLDGTLLGDDGEVSAANADALARASAAGVRVVIATGRPPRWLDHLLHSLNSSLALVCNGGMVVDLESGEVLLSHPLDGAALFRAVEELRAEGADFAVAGEGAREMGIAVEPHFPFSSPREVDRVELAEICAAPIVKALIRPIGDDHGRIVAHLVDNYADQFTVTRSTDDGLIELSRGGITKGAVITRLAADWGIDPADAIAFGDMPNDIEMLTWAGRAYAMGNADAAVKSIATETIGDHDDSAVAAVLARWF